MFVAVFKIHFQYGICQKRDKECHFEVVRLLSRRQIRQIRSIRHKPVAERRMPDDDEDERIDLDALNEMIEVQEQERRRIRLRRKLMHQVHAPFGDV